MEFINADFASCLAGRGKLKMKLIKKSMENLYLDPSQLKDILIKMDLPNTIINDYRIIKDQISFRLQDGTIFSIFMGNALSPYPYFRKKKGRELHYYSTSLEEVTASFDMGDNFYCDDIIEFWEK